VVQGFDTLIIPRRGLRGTADVKRVRSNHFQDGGADDLSCLDTYIAEG
jgi:hypothetical protein